MQHCVLLSDRAVLAVAGADARGFLQGLVTNDVTQSSAAGGVYTALLTPQGKLLFDFFLVETAPDRILIDVAEARAADLLKRLTLYRLRAKLTLERTDLAVTACWNGDAPQIEQTIAFRDPRLAELGWRLVGPAEQLRAHTDASLTDYHDHRLALGVPDSADLPPDQVFPLDAGFEELNGISFRKGCYVGQEVTARMKHRSTARRRMLVVETNGDLPAPGTALEAGGREIGTLAGGRDRRALALVRLDRLADAEAAAAEIRAGGVSATVRKPAWLRV
jgi:folate-binding protein YgfZ